MHALGMGMVLGAALSFGVLTLIDLMNPRSDGLVSTRNVVPFLLLAFAFTFLMQS